jgi:tripartite ATP-independent transporter DctM subunit
MSPEINGLFIAVTLIILMFLGVPVAFALGLTAIFFLYLEEGVAALPGVAETFFAGLGEFSLLSIPMFIVMGAAVAASPAGRDLYEALDRWLNRVPGGLVISNIGACTIFSALSGSSPATCAAIGKMGIPEMRQRGYPDGIATGAIAAGGTLGILVPPSITMIVYGVATQTSIGRLFIAGILPGCLLAGLFIAWSLFYAWWNGYQLTGLKSFSMRERLTILPRVLPFIAIIVGILYVLYGGVATPSEAAGVGALFCILLAIIIYGLWQPSHIWRILSTSMNESVMILMIIGASALFSFTLSYLFVTQSIAGAIVGAEMNRWVLLAVINVFLLVAGMFLPPVAVILMTTPILLPIVTQAGFDPYWFAVVLTINMEIGLITPPVGLNLYVINGIVPEVPLKTVLLGAIPYMLCMVTAIVILCIFPEIATWLPNQMLGAAI